MKDYKKLNQLILNMQEAIMTAYDRGYDDGVVKGRKQAEYARGYEAALRDNLELRGGEQKEIRSCGTCLYEFAGADDQPCRDCGTMFKNFTNWKAK